MEAISRTSCKTVKIIYSAFIYFLGSILGVTMKLEIRMAVTI
jgi:hypothetical protein